MGFIKTPTFRCDLHYLLAGSYHEQIEVTKAPSEDPDHNPRHKDALDKLSCENTASTCIELGLQCGKLNVLVRELRS
jgi:hypothetical protein